MGQRDTVTSNKNCFSGVPQSSLEKIANIRTRATPPVSAKTEGLATIISPKPESDSPALVR